MQETDGCEVVSIPETFFDVYICIVTDSTSAVGRYRDKLSSISGVGTAEA